MEVVSQLPRLESLSIFENPFCKNLTFSEYCIYAAPQILVLDSKKVSEEQRQMASQIFQGVAVTAS